MIQLDLSFFKSDLVTQYKRFVERGGKRCLHYDGEAVLLKLIILSSEGVNFIDKRDFIKKADVPKGTGELVWDFCIEKEILSMNEKGLFTAKEWVCENGFSEEATNTRPPTKRQIEFVPRRVMPSDLGLDENDVKDLRPIYRTSENSIIAVHLFYDWMCAKKEAGTWNPKTDIKKQLLCKERDWYKKALNLVKWNREEYLEKIRDVSSELAIIGV